VRRAEVKGGDPAPDVALALVSDILSDIKINLQKIHEHGSRADGIVKSMLQHSRGGTGKMEPTDLNALVSEFVNLSYHGMRAGKTRSTPRSPSISTAASARSHWSTKTSPA
jgi:hypothetical protein